MFKSVLFVCVGNVCRSPVAEGLLKHYSEKYNLGLRVASAGVHALVGEPAQPYSIEVAKENGIDISEHRAEQITQEMVFNHEIIIVLDEIIRKDVINRYPFAAGKVKKLGFLNNDIDIEDPYKKGKGEFVGMYSEVERCLGSWLTKIFSVKK